MIKKLMWIAGKGITLGVLVSGCLALVAFPLGVVLSGEAQWYQLPGFAIQISSGLLWFRIGCKSSIFKVLLEE